MTGIFQWFDRHKMSDSGRRISDKNHQRTRSRHSQFTDGRLVEEFNVAYQRQPAHMNCNRNASDRQRFSTESSRASFSSSRSSSFSSVDYYRSTQPDPAYNDRITFTEDAFDDSHSSVPPKIGRHSAEFWKVVKEARGLSIQTTSRDEDTNCASKQRDTLRDLNLFKTVDGAMTSCNRNMRDNLKESIRVPSTPRGAEWIYDGGKDQRRMSDHVYMPRDTSNEMETRRLSFDSREVVSASKLRDLPRLSLDGREVQMRSVDCTVSNFHRDTSLNRSCSTKEKGQDQQKVQGTRQRGSPSLIAKLMGLTALPYTDLVTQNDLSFDKTDNGQGGLDELNHGKPILDSKAPSSKKVSDFPKWISSEMMPISSSKIPMEQAPWKNQKRGVSLLKQSPRKIRSPTRHSNPIPSVYSEIEKQFKDIEFNNSGKDLRALKQILESIHVKELLEDEKQEQASKFATSGKQESTLINLNHKSAPEGQLNAQREHLASAIPRHDKPPNSHIMIMKPVSRSPRSQTSKNTCKDHAFSSHEKCKSTQLTVRPPEQPNNNTARAPRNLGSISPRERLKKLEFEKPNQVQSQASDANKHRGHISKQPTESSSPSRKIQPKLVNKQQSSSQTSETVLTIKKKRSQTNEAPLPTYRSMDSKKDKDATRTIRATKINGSHSPSKKASKPVCLATNKSSNHSSLLVKHDDTPPEYTSPVSVLNLSPYTDDSSTEEKQLATPPEELAGSYGELGITSELSRKKLLSIDSLVKKLKQLNSTHDESRTDYIVSLCDNKNPDQRYMSEILLASGLLLREFGSNAMPFQLHSSGFIINPELFNVLEQTKSNAYISNNANSDESKSHRKLIFDAVNEILTKKLATDGFLDYTAKHDKLAKNVLNTQNLIKEICAEMEQLLTKKKQDNKTETEDESDDLKEMLREDVMRPSDSWINFQEGKSEVVLDIERSLFKKLISEIVGSEYRVRPKSRNQHNRFIK